MFDSDATSPWVTAESSFFEHPGIDASMTIEIMKHLKMQCESMVFSLLWLY